MTERIKKFESLWASLIRVIGKMLPMVVSILLVLALLLAGSRLIERSSRAQSIRLATESIQRASVQCYALEGFYPRNLDYLVARYGILVDQDVYFVHYQYIADNLAPDVTVMLREGGRR